MTAPAVRMSEDQLMTGLLEAALMGGWMVHHSETVFDARQDRWRTPLIGTPGLPDLVLAHHERGLFLMIETKDDRNGLEPDQALWHAALRAAGVDIRVIRPDAYDATWQFLVGDRLIQMRGNPHG